MNLDALMEMRRTTGSALGPDIFRLFGLARYSGAMRMVELGVGCGASTTALLCALEENDGISLTSIDIKPKCEFVIKAHPLWRFICADSTDETLPNRLGVAPDSFAFLFVDSSHLYGQTVKELRIWLPLLSVGGLAAFHDTKSRWKDGVLRPIQEFLLAPPFAKWSYREYPESRNGIGVLTREG